jgi:putative addiction module component (TIGR02574 family)
MSGAAKAVFRAALKLDPAERAQVAQGLIESLDAAPDEDAERLWNAELARRREKIERGEATFHSLEELQKRVEKALGGG